MIEVSITSHGGHYELASIRIENVRVNSDETADYSVQFVTNRSGSLGLHRRPIHCFPRKEYNALALLLQALKTLEPEELKLDGEVGSPDVARQERGTVREIQEGEGRLRSD